MMKETLVGSLSILAGCLFIIFRKSAAREIIEGQNEAWGFNFGRNEIIGTEILLIIFGVITILFGMLSIFRIIHFK